MRQGHILKRSGISRCCKQLTRISHRISTAAAATGMSTALRAVGFLDVLSSATAESDRRAPYIQAHLRRLATKPREKCGFIAPEDCLLIQRNAALGL